MSNENTTEESTKDKIVKFIDAISGENYADANKYLQSAVEDKLSKNPSSSRKTTLLNYE